MTLLDLSDSLEEDDKPEGCGSYLLVFFFFFCNPVFIALRYKKLHAVLAMAKTKPINNPTTRFTSSGEKSNTPNP